MDSLKVFASNKKELVVGNFRMKARVSTIQTGDIKTLQVR